ncbi:helix-turn-helix transcriptional regulator [Kutzneria buriramensis]|nr:helix-turn-helix transcriptional regulator [Kutzneria buriramensis]
MIGRKAAVRLQLGAGRRITPLIDDGTAVAKLKLYLRDCLDHKTLREAAYRCDVSVSTLSKALNGTALPNRKLVRQLARLTGNKETVARADTLWRLAAIEDLGLQPKDLIFPNPQTVAELATVLRAYLVDNNHRYELTPDSVAMLSRHDKTADGSVSTSTINRMLSGKKLPSDKALVAFLSVVGVNATIRAKLLTARNVLAEERRQVAV